MLAVAAVVVIAVAGISLLRQPSNSGVGGSSPSPEPTPSPSTAPSAGAVFPEWYTTNDLSAAGILPAGKATTKRFLSGSTFNVPAGWVNTTDTTDFYGLFPDTAANKAEFGLSGSTAQNIVMGIVDSPSGLVCDGVDVTGATAAELVDSLVADETLVTSEPVEVTIGGLTGTSVDAHVDPASAGSCAKDYRGRFVFLDIPGGGGKLLIVIDSAHAADFDGLLGMAMSVVESFEFDLSN
ncbi:MAG TPA: hypothetical protein VFV72_02015 [Candidatus Limnocylindrales bacterium]|nr:hypothetical protein [Candidatus Limnocylindrales bacterium]